MAASTAQQNTHTRLQTHRPRNRTHTYRHINRHVMLPLTRTPIVEREGGLRYMFSVPPVAVRGVCVQHDKEDQLSRLQMVQSLAKDRYRFLQNHGKDSVSCYDEYFPKAAFSVISVVFLYSRRLYIFVFIKLSYSSADSNQNVFMASTLSTIPSLPFLRCQVSVLLGESTFKNAFHSRSHDTFVLGMISNTLCLYVNL